MPHGARRKAIIAAAEENAACFVTATRDAIKKLRDLGVPVHEIAELCRISTGKAREYLGAPPAAGRVGTGTASDTGADARADSAAEDENGDAGRSRELPSGGSVLRDGVVKDVPAEEGAEVLARIWTSGLVRRQ